MQSTSAIDPTVPIFGTPTTASVRNNFLHAYNEITALMQEVSSGPSTGGFIVGIVTGGGPSYTVVPPTNYVSVRQAPPLTIVLPPSPASGYSVMVKDSLGGSSPVNQILIQSSTALIDGASSFVINVGYSAFRFTFDGTSWGVSG